MNTQEIVSRIEPILRKTVDREVERELAQRMEAVRNERTALAEAHAEILGAARQVASLTDRLEQARFAGKSENAARKALFLANLRLATVMRRHGRMT